MSRTRRRVQSDHEQYKWWALSCTSVGMLLATINSGTLIIALPDLERSLDTTLLSLVWVILAYMIASTVLVVTAGRLSDLFGRTRAYVLGILASLWAANVLHEVGRSDGTRKLDLVGTALFIGGLTGLVLAISKGGLSGWSDPVVVVGFAVAAVLLPLFVVVESRGEAPML